MIEGISLKSTRLNERHRQARATSPFNRETMMICIKFLKLFRNRINVWKGMAHPLTFSLHLAALDTRAAALSFDEKSLFVLLF